MTATDVLAEPIGAPEPEPPRRDLTPRQWVRANLFSSPFNSALTVVIGLGAAYVLVRLARWAFVTAEWAVVRVNLRLFMVGFFPVDQLWRLWVALYVLVATCGLAAGALAEASRRVADGAEEDRVVAAQLVEYRVGQRLPGRVVTGGTEIVGGGLHLRTGRMENLEAFGDDLGADPVTGDDREADGA